MRFIFLIIIVFPFFLFIIQTWSTIISVFLIVFPEITNYKKFFSLTFVTIFQFMHFTM